MLKIYSTGPIINSNEATPTPAVFSNKFKLVFDPIQNTHFSDCCPCYIVATLYSSDGTALTKTLVTSSTAVLSEASYSVIEFANLTPLTYEIEIKAFCPGVIPIVNILGENGASAPFTLVPCHCFKFKDLVIKEVKCNCTEHDSDDDEYDENPCHKESCERPLKKRNRC